MLIANPIYDVVFKRMMENEKVAKFFIGTLLDETIESIEVQPQEFTYTDAIAAIAVFRLDFIATITTARGERKKVLIEIQKAKNFVDLIRFRSYLAEQYRATDSINGAKVALPITTIYVLGFKLPEIETPCLKVERSYKDLTNKTMLFTKSDFIERLTHDSFIVQVDRITDRYQTRLDKLLSVFEQTNFVDATHITKEFTHELDIEELKIATDILHHAGTNPAQKKQLENEQEAWRTIDVAMGGAREKLLEASKRLQEKDQVILEKDQALTEKDQALTEQKQALTEKDQELQALKQQMEEMKRQRGG
jgi:hypothetical protein